MPTQVGSVFGYVQARVTKEVLQKACDNKDLTRQGVLTALHQLSGLDTGGLVAGTLDYTKAGQPPSRTRLHLPGRRERPGWTQGRRGPGRGRAGQGLSGRSMSP